MALQNVCGLQETYSYPGGSSPARRDATLHFGGLDEGHLPWKELCSTGLDSPLHLFVPLSDLLTQNPLQFVTNGNDFLYSSSSLDHMPFSLAHGTTTLAFVFEGGVIAAADTRASCANSIACPAVEKIMPVHSHLVATSSGSGADCMFWQRVLARECRLYHLRHHRKLSIGGTAKLLAHMLHPFKGTNVCVALTLCGWDGTEEEEEGCQRGLVLEEEEETMSCGATWESRCGRALGKRMPGKCSDATLTAGGDEQVPGEKQRESGMEPRTGKRRTGKGKRGTHAGRAQSLSGKEESWAGRLAVSGGGVGSQGRSTRWESGNGRKLLGEISQPLTRGASTGAQLGEGSTQSLTGAQPEEGSTQSLTGGASTGAQQGEGSTQSLTGAQQGEGSTQSLTGGASTGAQQGEGSTESLTGGASTGAQQGEGSTQSLTGGASTGAHQAGSVQSLTGGASTGGPRLYYVCSDGTRLRGELFSVGSGSPYAYSVLDSGLAWGLRLTEACSLAREAVYRATYRDAYSGNNVDLYHITSQGWRRRQREDLKEEYYRERRRRSRGYTE